MTVFFIDTAARGGSRKVSSISMRTIADEYANPMLPSELKMPKICFLGFVLVLGVGFEAGVKSGL